MPSVASPQTSNPDPVPDWFLGGRRRRRLLELLSAERADGWTVAELKAEAPCGQATAYEVVGALAEIGLLGPPDPAHRYRFDPEHQLAQPLRQMLRALDPFAAVAVRRPSRGERRT
jgi:DNA-binding IclR family transcriptional regulator